MNYLNERIKKLEEYLIPDTAAKFIITRDLEQQGLLYIKLWEYHVELRERKEEVRKREHDFRYSR